MSSQGEDDHIVTVKEGGEESFFEDSDDEVESQKEQKVEVREEVREEEGLQEEEELRQAQELQRMEVQVDGEVEEKEEKVEERRVVAVEEEDDGFFEEEEKGSEHLNVGSGGRSAGPNAVLGILYVLTALALYVFIAGCLLLGSPNADIAVGFSFLSMFFTGGKVVLEMRSTEVPPFVDILLGVSLVLLWVGGVFVFTFANPFRLPGTGYFSSWLCLVFSAYYAVLIWGRSVSINAKSMKNYKQDLSPIIAIAILTSGGVITQASAEIITTQVALAGTVFALVLGVLSTILLIVMLVLPIDVLGGPAGVFIMSGVLLVLWVLGVLFTTLGAPFFVVVTGAVTNGGVVANGFYSTWVCFLAAVLLVWRTASLVRNDPAADKRLKIKARIMLQVQLVVSSFFVLVAGSIQCSVGGGCQNGFFVYGILSGTFSSAGVIGAIITFRENPERATGDPQFGSNTTNEIMASVLLFAWWLIAVVLLTFPSSAPFFSTSTGYLAVWTSFAFSAFYLNQIFPGLVELIRNNEKIQQCAKCCSGGSRQSRRSKYGLFVTGAALVVEAFALMVVCLDNSCGANEITGLVFCGLSFVFVAVLLYVQPSKLVQSAIGLNLLFVLLWFIGLAFLTLDRPFVNAVGNGYYACWAILGGGVYTLNRYEYDFTMITDSSNDSDAGEEEDD